MMTCGGMKDNGKNKCNSIVYRCSKCGTVGCKTQGCTNQKFNFGKCVVCGNYGTTQQA